MLVCAKDRITKCALKVTKHKKGKNKKEQRKNWLKENKQWYHCRELKVYLGKKFQILLDYPFSYMFSHDQFDCTIKQIQT